MDPPMRLLHPAATTDHGPPVTGVMIREPRTLPSDVTVGAVRSAFEDDHVVMVLLTDNGRLEGTLVRDDLPAGTAAAAPALRLSDLTGRTVGPTATAASVLRQLLHDGRRRLAVVDEEGRLLGLVCLNRRRTGFCSDACVAARARTREAHRPQR